MAEMMTVQVKIAVNKLSIISAAAKQLLQAVLDKSGEDIAAHAKRLIVSQHIIKTSATLNSTKSRKRRGEPWARYIGPTTSYSPFLEYGTKRMAARPFMTPAFETVRPVFLQAIEQALNQSAGG